MSRPVVIFGIYGTVLDRPSARRWERWRPTVSLVGRDDLLVSRFILVHDARHAEEAALAAADMRQVSPETEVVVRASGIADPWDFEEVYGALHDLVEDLAFDPAKEDLLVHITTGSHVQQICLFLLTESRRLPGRLIQTSPPRPRGSDQRGSFSIIDLDLSRYDRLASRFERERREGESMLKSGIATQNAAFNRMVARIEQVAGATRAPILLLGPTGAGKSQLARRIHELKRQRQGVQGQFVELNCATLKGDAAMSALFGHVKGAFTGALTDRQGLLRAAHGGVLLLDEIGELGVDEQAMLLRALEERRFLPLGSDKEVSSDFQLIAGTNRDLKAAVHAGRFRADLLARIDLWTFTLPALRQRPEDMEPNLDFEIAAASRTLARRITMSHEARAAYLAFARSPGATWAGNFRDLNASVTRLATLARGGRITETDVQEEIGRLSDAWTPPELAAGGATGAAPEDDDLLASLVPADILSTLDRFDRVQLLDVLRVCRQARSLAEAGRILFAASRARRSSTNDTDRLRKYLTRFGVRDLRAPPA